MLKSACVVKAGRRIYEVRLHGAFGDMAKSAEHGFEDYEFVLQNIGVVM
ncbi:MAG: hypothetical protein GDA52_03820 [Rhodobacteraceae bacterium]|nr:hypothetical protein [Paracoccaceae bacterium]